MSSGTGEKKFKVELLAIETYPSIAKYMIERKFKKHEYDLWHDTKSVKKKQFKKMVKKGRKDLVEWMKAITNHLWWSANTCAGDVKKLKESWLLLKYHIVNKHIWKAGEKQYSCNCLPLSEENITKTKWQSLVVQPI